MHPRQFPQTPADAIVLLGAAVWTAGRPSPTLLRRIEHAAALYHAGAAPIIVGCGGLGKHPPAEAEVMKRELIALGVAEGAIRTETRSRTTLENAVFSARILRRENLESLLVVSDRYHLPRAILCFKTLGFSTTGSGPDRRTTDLPFRAWIYSCLRECAAYPLYRIKLRALRRRNQKSNRTG